MKLAAMCAEGIEDIVIKELNSFGKTTNIEISKGMILFDFEGEIKKLREIKTAEDIMILVKKFSGISRYKTSLRNIRHQCAKSGFIPKIKQIETFRKVDSTFSVKASYIGRRDYKAIEIEEAATAGVTKFGLKFYTPGCLLFRVILTPEISFLGLSLEKQPLEEINKYNTVPGSLKPSVANSLLKVAEVEKEEVVLDPMCGTGVIAIESNKLGANAIAGDIDKERIKIAEQNTKSKKAEVVFHIWDARKTGLHEKSVDKVVSNLPFEKQTSISGFNETFFYDFLKEMIRVSKEDARFVFLTAHSEIIEPQLEKLSLKLINMKRIVNSGLESEIMIINKA